MRQNSCVPPTSEKWYVLSLLAASVLWGSCYISQALGGNLLSPFSFVFYRYFFAAVSLLPPSLVALRGVSPEKRMRTASGSVKTGLLCGIPLFVGILFQQIGFSEGTSAGKAAFLTSLYLLFVPMFGFFTGKRPTAAFLFAVLLAISGSFLLCWPTELASFRRGDLFEILGALGFALQIIVIERFSAESHPIVQSCAACAICACLTLAASFFLRDQVVFPLQGDAMLPVLYAGVFGSAVADTLQFVGQKRVDPNTTSLLMSLESVFGMLFGILLLGEPVGFREILGSTLILSSVLLVRFTE